MPHGQDRFQRVKRSDSTDRGAVTRRYDAADRLVQSTDAKGSWASYEYDLVGRIVRQTLTDPRAPMGQRQSVTIGALMTGTDHPDQQERYTHDAAGRVTTKTVTLSPTGGKAVTGVTQYVYDRSGRLSGVSLPDGSMWNTIATVKDRLLRLSVTVSEPGGYAGFDRQKSSCKTWAATPSGYAARHMEMAFVHDTL